MKSTGPVKCSRFALRSMSIAVHAGEDLRTQAMPLQQVAELAHRRLIGHRLLAEVDGNEMTHRHRVVESLFHSRVRQVEPLLQNPRRTYISTARTH